MIWSHENAFFKVQLLGQGALKDVVSFSITEEVNKADEMSLTLYDPFHTYTRELSFGKRVVIDWGTSGLMGVARQNTGIVTAASGAGSDKGLVTTSINIQSITEIKTTNKIYKKLPKAAVVTQTLLAMGVILQVVEFPNMYESEEQVIQNENNFAFLVRLSREWRCYFRLAYTKLGVLCGAFCTPENLYRFAKLLGGRGAVKLGYGTLDNLDEDLGLVPNVISYSWTYNPTGSAGQGATVTVLNGVPQLTPLLTANESVQTWRLNTDKCIIAAKKYAGDSEGLAKFWRNVLQPAIGWETAREYYEVDNQNTASDTFGYTLSCTVQGDPGISAGSMIFFGKGFPDFFGATDRTWWTRSVRHEMSSQGYLTTIEVVDSIQMSDTGIQIPMVMDYILNEAQAQ